MAELLVQGVLLVRAETIRGAIFYRRNVEVCATTEAVIVNKVNRLREFGGDTDGTVSVLCN